jgi:hypothetical protein
MEKYSQARPARSTATYGLTSMYQIHELVVFEERLDNSLQRDLVKIEHVRLRISHESISSELVDMELIELKFIFDRRVSLFAIYLLLQLNSMSVHHDNRDMGILPNYQPRALPSFSSQTTLFGKEPGVSALYSAAARRSLHVIRQGGCLYSSKSTLKLCREPVTWTSRLRMISYSLAIARDRVITQTQRYP